MTLALSANVEQKLLMGRDVLFNWFTVYHGNKAAIYITIFQTRSVKKESFVYQQTSMAIHSLIKKQLLSNASFSVNMYVYKLY